MKDRPVLIEFYADWCPHCKALERKTFRDERVLAKSKGFIMLKVDCTTPDNTCSALAEEMNVTGLPTMVFLSHKGEELRALRTVGFVDPAEMLKRMDAAMPGLADSP
jgi:thiol:disulfide interchange protein DsbD